MLKITHNPGDTGQDNCQQHPCVDPTQGMKAKYPAFTYFKPSKAWTSIPDQEAVSG